MGSLLAALASHQHAKQHNGTWLVRIEDVDTMRAQTGADETILRQLQAHGFASDETIVYQSQRSTFYAQALQQLKDMGLAYPCICSRKTIRQTLDAQGIPPERHRSAVYPGICRDKPVQSNNKKAAWRLDVGKAMQWIAEHLAFETGKIPSINANTVLWNDERLGMQAQNIVAEIGDFVLQRADGCYSYQIAVVVDDAAQGITHVVRGEDLADNTPRQIVLQLLLGLPLLHYLHTPLILGDNGEKLSKQNGAQALDLDRVQENLRICRKMYCQPAQ